MNNKNMNKNGFILVIIDVIVVTVVILLAIWFLVKGYPNTLGSIIHIF